MSDTDACDERCGLCNQLYDEDETAEFIPCYVCEHTTCCKCRVEVDCNKQLQQYHKHFVCQTCAPMQGVSWFIERCDNLCLYEYSREEVGDNNCFECVACLKQVCEQCDHRAIFPLCSYCGAGDIDTSEADEDEDRD